ncbi:MAG: protein kinase [Polyangiaceae bacterium]
MTAPHNGPRDRAPARVGQVLRGKWHLDELLAVGGMASVFAATHRNGKRGAVKLLHYELSLHEESRSRFLREGYVANKVDHEGAVSVLDDDVCDDGTVFLVMELLDGQTVDAMLRGRSGRSFGLGETLRVADQLLDVLAAAHEKGVVHRDIKPENLFVTQAGKLKVLDFGIARLRESAATASTTRAGDLLGAPSPVPPERALGNLEIVDARSDLWAAGAAMFRLLTGRPVHHAESIQPRPPRRDDDARDPSRASSPRSPRSSPASSIAPSPSSSATSSPTPARCARPSAPLPREAVSASKARSPRPLKSPAPAPPRSRWTPPRAAPGPHPRGPRLHPDRPRRDRPAPGLSAPGLSGVHMPAPSVRTPAQPPG